MMKKIVFITLTMLLNNSTQELYAEQKDTLKINQQNEKTEDSLDSRYNVGSIILSTTATLAGAFVLDNLIRSCAPQHQKSLNIEGHHIIMIAGIVTAGAVIVEGMNCVEKLCNPIEQKKPKLKTVLAQEGV